MALNQQPNVQQSIENNFTKGLVTEFNGLNFPENAATSASNTEFTLVGDVIRRQGIDKEVNGVNAVRARTNQAVSTYRWSNAGGDGLTQVIVEQVGNTLYFYKSSASSIAAPISTQILASTVLVSSFVVAGSSFDVTQECQYTDGNGYLFVFHPGCDPFYCTYNAGTITGNVITVQIRDQAGIPELGVAANFRPSTLTNEHKYNLVNQGWVAGNPWSANSTTSVSFSTGAKTFIVATGLTGIVGGQSVVAYAGSSPGSSSLVGTVTSYTSGSGVLILSITSFTLSFGTNSPNAVWLIIPADSGRINTWFSAVGNYPSNADQWWNFKNSSNVFDPATTQANTFIGSGQAPQGSMILNAFQQLRSAVSGVAGLTDITTTVRPKTGCWYQGRVWYTGVDGQQAASGDAPFTTWSENIYFSKIVQSTNDFGACYQTNDPTSQDLFGLLTSDGGVIKIQGSGSIYKLFPLMNALLIFAANGVYYLTGSQGIGFAANDFTIPQLSHVKCISSTSFVDVNGMPMFWNEEGIYTVEPAQQGKGLLNSPLHVNPLEVIPITVGTIQTFYDSIPIASKKYARAAYHPIDYVVQWLYRSTEETDVTSRYTYDSILNFNTHNKAFFPYAVDTTKGSINAITYVSYPTGGLGTPAPAFKYTATIGSNMTFAEEYDTTYVDWLSAGGTNYSSFFITGYKIHGQGQRRFQMPYITVYSRADTPVSYNIQGLWDYAISGNSGRWSVLQRVNIWSPNFGMVFRRHRIRGRGIVLQMKFTSADGQPFDIMGWSGFEIQNLGI